MLFLMLSLSGCQGLFIKSDHVDVNVMIAVFFNVVDYNYTPVNISVYGIEVNIEVSKMEQSVCCLNDMCKMVYAKHHAAIHLPKENQSSVSLLFQTDMAVYILSLMGVQHSHGTLHKPTWIYQGFTTGVQIFT